MKKLAMTALAVALLGAAGCSGGGTEPSETPDPTEGLARKSLSLSVGDSYDFSAMDLTLVASREGDNLVYSMSKSVIRAAAAGRSVLEVKDKAGTSLLYDVTVCGSAEELGADYPLDKGMFKGKKIIVFGDSITDGFLGNETDYSSVYYALLCQYFGASNDPTDTMNSNFACGGSTLTYGLRHNFGISGVERVSATAPFTDTVTGKRRDPYPNVQDADLCIVYYGANDMDENVKSSAKTLAGANDTPARMEEAVTIKGGAYFMLHKLRALNPNLKLLVLPPIYRRTTNPALMYYGEGYNDIYNMISGETLSGYTAVLKETAQECGARFLDWSHVFTYENFVLSDQYTMDGLHPNRAGHRLMYDFLISQIEK